MAGREIRFDPVAQPNQGPPRPGKGGGDAGTECYWPVMAQCLFPDQCDMGIGRTSNLDLIQWHARGKNAAEDLLNLGFTPAGVE